MKSLNSKIVLTMLALTVISCEDDDNAANERMIVQNDAGGVTNTQRPKNNTASGRSADDNMQPLYDGSESGSIDLTVAQAWVQHYRDASPADATQSHYFGRNVIDQILAQGGCTGLRVHYGLDDQGNKVLIISGVDSQGENMLPLSPTAQDGEYILADMSLPCPNVCPGGGNL
jgi:hypothetical protein